MSPTACPKARTIKLDEKGWIGTQSSTHFGGVLVALGGLPHDLTGFQYGCDSDQRLAQERIEVRTAHDADYALWEMRHADCV